MRNMPSPSKAERNQAAKRSYLPPIWPLIIALVVLFGIFFAVKH